MTATEPALCSIAALSVTLLPFPENILRGSGPQARSNFADEHRLLFCESALHSGRGRGSRRVVLLRPAPTLRRPVAARFVDCGAVHSASQEGGRPLGAETR